MLVICNGMTRSGSTLQYNLVRELVEHHNVGVAHGFFQPAAADQIDPAWLRDRTMHVVKMHGYWTPNYPVESRSVLRCYVYRDLRDVAASVFRKFPITFEELLGILDEAVATGDEIRSDESVCVQRYEELVAAPEESCHELSGFMDLPTSLEESKRITRQCLRQIETAHANFPSQQKTAHEGNYRRVRWLKRLSKLIPKACKGALKTLGIGNIADPLLSPRSQADPVTLIHPDHFSATRGQAGAWQTCFTEPEQQVLRKRYYSWLVENGYLIQ